MLCQYKGELENARRVNLLLTFCDLLNHSDQPGLWIETN